MSKQVTVTLMFDIATNRNGTDEPDLFDDAVGLFRDDLEISVAQLQDRVEHLASTGSGSTITIVVDGDVVAGGTVLSADEVTDDYSADPDSDEVWTDSYTDDDDNFDRMPYIPGLE